MANVYYQSTVQLIFAVRKREALITSDFKITLLKYISGILMNQDHKPLAVNCVAYQLSDRKRMTRYVENQERHHYGKIFREEYVETLKDHDIEYNEKYLFDFFE